MSGQQEFLEKLEQQLRNPELFKEVLFSVGRENIEGIINSLQDGLDRAEGLDDAVFNVNIRRDLDGLNVIVAITKEDPRLSKVSEEFDKHIKKLSELDPELASNMKKVVMDALDRKSTKNKQDFKEDTIEEAMQNIEDFNVENIDGYLCSAEENLHKLQTNFKGGCTEEDVDILEEALDIHKKFISKISEVSEKEYSQYDKKKVEKLFNLELDIYSYIKDILENNK